MRSSNDSLQFGIYPFSPAGTPTGLAVGPADDIDKIRQAIDDLRGSAHSFVPRTYLVSTGPGSERTTMTTLDRWRREGVLGHVVVGTIEEQLDLDAWGALLCRIVAEHGSTLASLQVTNEPNLTFMEGAKPYILQALIEGVLTAKQEALSRQLSLEIGFGSVPDSPVALPGFWDDLARVGGLAFAEAVDFVGVNFYVDVFEDQPLALDALPMAVERTLTDLRRRDLVAAGIPHSVPLRVTENGWPTGRNPLTGAARPYERQAEVLDIVVRTIHRLRHELNISHYVLFGLRDADSAQDDLFHQYGILRDDYRPKPAYETYRALIDELGC